MHLQQVYQLRLKLLHLQIFEPQRVQQLRQLVFVLHMLHLHLQFFMPQLLQQLHQQVFKLLKQQRLLQRLSLHLFRLH